MQNNRAFLWIVLAALVVGLGLSEFSRQREAQEARARDASLARDIADIQTEVKAAYTSLIPQDVVLTADQSVYAIVVGNRLLGTAFVVDREKGLLATAAHVAAALPFDDEDAIITIRNRSNAAALRVTDRQTHAGYGAFRALIEEFQPVRPNTPVLTPQILPLRDLAFDVGLLKVDPVDPATGENVLGANLPIADEEALLLLSAGAPIAVIGFPYDTLNDTFASDAVTSRVDRGVISAMIAPLDNANRISNAEIANLIIHRLSTAGGNSGSPIINSSGAVIGIHSHGIESTSGNADGAAQRADMLIDMLIDGRDEARLSELFLPAWRETLEFWRSAKDVLPWSFYLERADRDGAADILVSDLNSENEPPFSQNRTDLTFGEAQKTYLALATDLLPSALRAEQTPTSRSAAGAIASGAQDDGALGFKIEREGEYARATFVVDRSQENIIYAFDYTLRRSLGFCFLTTYWRKVGEPELRVQERRPTTEIYLPKRESGGIEEYGLVFHRKAKCDPASSAFVANIVSWDGEPPNQANRSLDGIGAVIAATFSTDREIIQLGASSASALHGAVSWATSWAAKVERFASSVRCRLPSMGRSERAGGRPSDICEFSKSQPTLIPVQLIDTQSIHHLSGTDDIFGAENPSQPDTPPVHRPAQ